MNIFHRFRLKYRWKRRRVFSPSAVPGSIVVVGVVGQGQAGTASTQISTGALTGVSGAGQAGSPIAQVSALAIGVAGAGQVGTLFVQQGPIGVQGDGFAGSVLPSPSVIAAAVTGNGQVGSLFNSQTVAIVGVYGTGEVGDIYPIPPAPRTRPPLFIPVENGLPASLWLGSTNGD